MTLAERLTEILRRIDAREVKLILDPRPREEWWNGYPTYYAEGWEFVVFDDCDCWDYLEKVTTPEGDVIEYPTEAWNKATAAEMVLMAYGPEHLEDWGYEPYTGPTTTDGPVDPTATIADLVFTKSPLLEFLRKRCR